MWNRILPLRYKRDHDVAAKREARLSEYLDGTVRSTSILPIFRPITDPDFVIASHLPHLPLAEFALLRNQSVFTHSSMAPRSRKRSSNDFVVPDNEDEDAPRAKRVKSEKGGKSTKAAKSASFKVISESKKSSARDDAIVVGGGKLSKEGEEYWEVCSCLPNTNRTFGN